MAEVEFSIEDGMQPLSGLAVMYASDEDGNTFIFHSQLPGTKPHEMVGLLTTALDQIRYTFMDKEISPEDLFGSDEDDEDEED